jgi:hypothetical protein
MQIILVSTSRELRTIPDIGNKDELFYYDMIAITIIGTQTVFVECIL